MRDYLENLPKKIKLAILGGGIALLGVIVVLIILLPNRKSEDISKGVQVIRKMEAGNVTKIENSIDELDRVDVERKQREQNKQAAADTFLKAEAVVMGDRFAQGLADHDVLNPASIIGEKKILLTDDKKIQGQLDILKGMKPKVLFLSYGSADIPKTDGDLQLFREQYKTLLVEVQRMLPKTKIYVCTIPYVQKSAYEISTAYKQVSEYNDVLRELCRENNVSVVDTGSWITDKMYESDGINMKESYFRECVSHLIEMAGL